MKNRILLFIIAGCFALFFASCLDSEEIEYVPSRDCEITSFSLASDSIPELSSVRFTIDQVKGRIFNMDSLKYGTVLDEKVICSISMSGTVVECKVMQEAKGDTLLWQDVDSLDFSKPVKFVTKLWDGITTKAYLAYINIHKVVPDSMQWENHARQVVDFPIKDEKVITFSTSDSPEEYFMYVQPENITEGYKLYCSSVGDGKKWQEYEIKGLPVGEVLLSQMTIFNNKIFVSTKSGKLYSSADGKNWNKIENTPIITTLLGTISTDDRLVTSSQHSVMAFITEQEGEHYFSCLDEKGEWLPKTKEELKNVPDDFPIKGFASTSYYAMYCARLSIFGGYRLGGGLTNKTWGTTDGLNWQMLNFNSGAIPFEPMEGMSVVEYDNTKGEEGKFFMLGGINEEGKASSSIYVTLDGGLSWTVSDTLTVMPTDFKARGYMSVHVDNQNYMYLFGGKEEKNSNVIDEVWRGRINRLGFDYTPLH